MRRRAPFLILTLALSFPIASTSAQQLGDVNGDGRVSFGDAFLLSRWLDTGLDVFEPAPGSADFDAEIVCTHSNDLPSLVYLEALRRASPEARPHFVERWPAAEPNGAPPPIDGAVRLEVVPIVHDSSQAQVELQVELSTSLPLGFVSFVLQAEDLDLRPVRPQNPNRIQDALTPRSISEYYLVSGGLLAAHSDELSNPFPPRTVGPSEGVVLTTHATLPRGTPPGTYRVDLLPSAEVVTPAGDLLRPSVSSGTLQVLRAIESGHDLPFPPLDLTDDGSRRVLGLAELRVTDAEANPEEEIRVAVQIRTERAVNRARFKLSWDPQVLTLMNASAAYSDPEFGRPRDLDHDIEVFEGSPALDLPASVTYRYYPHPLEVADDSAVTELERLAVVRYHPYSNGSAPPSLKFIQPLGEWVDLLELRFLVRPEARGRGDLSLQLLDNDVVAPRALFLPYGAGCDERSRVWESETRSSSGTVTVLGGGDPPPAPDPPVDPKDANIRVCLGEFGVGGEPIDVEAELDEIVRLPLLVRTDIPIWRWRFVYDFDETELELVAFEVNFLDFDGRPYTQTIVPGQEPCPVAVGKPPPDADFPPPTFAQLHDERNDVPPPPGMFVADVLTEGSNFGAWQPGTHDIGAVFFRVKDDATAELTQVFGGQVTFEPSICWRSNPDSTTAVTSGVPPFDVFDPPPRIDVPAVEVKGARILILQEGRSFIRGDSNRDSNVDVSDAVNTLNTLFLGAGTLECEDAADSNDDGNVDLSDAVFALNHLFLGGTRFSLPFPEPGPDPTPDGIDCSGG